MNVNIGDYYEAKLARLIARGVAANKTEALRQAVTAYERQLEEEEATLVLERIHEDEARWAKSKAKWTSLDDLLREHKIDKSKL